MLRRFFPAASLACLLAGTILTPLGTKAQVKDTDLPTDPNVKVGRLSNGLTYYIRPNSKPEKKVELRLIVNVGALLENENQQGLAHFMEHMNFNGTKNYPKNKLIDFLQSIGVEFGADLNAYTGFDQTVYILPIPTDKPGNLESGFQVIEDWAHNANLTTTDINEERNVVLEESRSGKGANDRMMRKLLPRMFAGSQYANRIPIGKEDIIKNFDPELIRSFYKDWYRPNLMAVAVAGDITVPQAEALIKKHFAGIQNPPGERPRKDYGVPPYTTASAMVITDKEATNSIFQLSFPYRKRNPELTLADYRAKLVEQLFMSLLNRRYEDLARGANPPFTEAGVDIEKMIRNEESFGLQVLLNADIETSVNVAIGELVKAAQFGFSPSELDIAKKQMFSTTEQAYNERNTTESKVFAEAYIHNFLDKEPIAGIGNEYKYYQNMLPGISLQEVNAEAKKWLGREQDQTHFALIQGPDSKQIKLPADQELKTIVDRALSQKVSPNAEKKIAQTLLDKEPVAGKITNETSDKDLGTTTYTLSNGVKVTVRKTDFKSDEIVMTAVKKGGGSNYGPEDKANIKFIGDVIETMSYGHFTPTALKDFLAGKTLELTPKMEGITSGLQARSSVKDLESLMQLTYLQLTSPRRDEDLFNAFISAEKTQLQFASANPQTAFIDTLIKFFFHNDPRLPITQPSITDIAQIRIDRVLDIYRDEFGNADGFHFFIVGNVDENAIKPLLEKYLASLPVKGTRPEFKDNGLRPISGQNKLVFKKGKEQMSLILMLMQNQGELPYTEELALETNIIGQILEIKALEHIREQMGAMYSGNLSAEFSKYPYPHYSVSGIFPCGPENVDPVIKQANQEILNIKTQGPSQKDLDKVKQAITEKRKEGIKTNDYWAGKLERLLFWDDSKDRFLNFDSNLDKITVADIQATANKLFDGKYTFTAVLMPEVTEAKKDALPQGTGK